MQKYAFPLLALLMLALPALPVSDFWITQLNYIGIYSMVSLGLVLLTGVAGLTSFGQAAFVGVGAYTAAFLAVKLGVSPWLTLLVGIAISIVVALVLGAITLRMSGHYLPLATIAWGLTIYYTISNMEFLGKYDGLLGVPPITLAGLSLGTGRGLYLLIWAFALASALAVTHLLAQDRHHHGRGDGHLDLALQGHRLRAGGGAGGHRRLAVRAFPAHCQPFALRHPQGH
jgi:branched-chain amino acid transport system permease protein